MVFQPFKFFRFHYFRLAWRVEKPFQNKSFGGKEPEATVERRPLCWQCGKYGHLKVSCKAPSNFKRPENAPVKRVYLLTECDDEVDEQNVESTEANENPENEEMENTDNVE